MINVRFFDKEQKEFDHEQEHGRESLQFFLNHGATGAFDISQDDVHDAIGARCVLLRLVSTFIGAAFAKPLPHYMYNVECMQIMGYGPQNRKGHTKLN